MHVSLANTAFYSFYGYLLICIPLKGELETRTWMQLTWEVIPGSRSEDRKTKKRKEEKTIKAELVIPLGTLQNVPQNSASKAQDSGGFI